MAKTAQVKNKVPDPHDLEVAITNTVMEAGSFWVVDDESYRGADEMLRVCRNKEGKIVEFFKPFKDQARKLWMDICDKEKRTLQSLYPAIRHLKEQMDKYQDEQEKVKREEGARLREQARKAEERVRMEEARVLKEEGREEEAEELLKEEIVVPHVVSGGNGGLAGVSRRIVWDFKIENVDLIPRNFMIPNERAIKAVVVAMKDRANIPGVKVFSKKVVVAGRRSG